MCSTTLIEGDRYSCQPYFSPFVIKDITLNNRLVLPPMANEASDESGMVNEKHLDFYRRRAGVGMVIVEHAYVQLAGRVKTNQLGIHDDKLIPGLRRLAEVIKTNGAVAGIQLAHGGGKATRAATGGALVAPSAGMVPGGTEPADALQQAQIAPLIADYVAAAQRAFAAGFDFVEIHGAHGYLLNQFLSPLTNHRNDNTEGISTGDCVCRLRSCGPFALPSARMRCCYIGWERVIFIRTGSPWMKAARQRKR